MNIDSANKLTPPVNERDHTQGLETAQITLVQYGNYECPHCRRIHSVLQARKRRLGERLRYVFRHLPTPAHPHAQLAAEAAEAAGAQGKFWEYHDYLYEQPYEVLNEEHLINAAKAVGLDIERFTQELRDHVYAEHVQEDFDSGMNSGVNGTPTFFLNGVRHDEPWDFYSVVEAAEKPLAVKIRLLAQDFTSLAASGSLVLLVCTILALVWANSPAAESYYELWESELIISLGQFSIAEHLLGWVNDGLMVIFFFVVGLEIKREVMSGELASPKRAALPIAGALGGMIAPAIIYTAFNLGGSGIPGWGIPMATDIAFTLGVLALLGSRAPLPLKIFFAALAIADDLGAVLVIAIFYTAEISFEALGVAAIFFIMLILLNQIKVYSAIPYAILGIFMWAAFLESGIHPTIAGVLVALTIPSRSPINIRPLLVQVQSVVDDFEVPKEWRDTIDSRRQATIQTLETITNKMQSPARRMEHQLHHLSIFLILPIFALANAGVELDVSAASHLISPVGLGIIFGLVLGKPIGISLLCWLTVKLGLAELPSGINWRHFVSSTFLAGIGFTMSLFIAGAAFPNDPVLLSSAKLAVFTASILAGVIGWVLVNMNSSVPQATNQNEVAVAAG
ncbi:MAG: Na+/H+ antiporter NhaA [Anaerolineae bacterium]|nr:Na+/H+ antiporter NhaA [Anaerolineae bacterium]